MNRSKSIRDEFPILRQTVHGHPLCLLDNGSTTQKPESVISAINDYYRTANGNVNRSFHALATRSGRIVEDARAQIAEWIRACGSEEIIFTSGTTAGINLVAFCVEQWIEKGDEILVSSMEHLSNWLPWCRVAERKGAIMKKIPLTSEGMVDQQAYDALLNDRTKFVAISHVSNVLGTINPVKEMSRKAHEYGAIVLVDAAQSIAHLPIDVGDIGCDFLVFSSHKMYGPTGLGILYVNKKMYKLMIPWQLGGGMLRSFSKKKSIYYPPPYQFEAGTLHLAGIAGLRAALSFLARVTYPVIQSHEGELVTYATRVLKMIPGVKILGEASHRIGIISFTVNGMHCLDVGIQLDAMGISVRTGKSCALPLMQDLGVEGTVRISLAIYNTRSDIDRLRDALVAITKGDTGP